MSEFPQNRPSCFSVAAAEEVAAAQRCLGKEPHEEEMLVDVVGPRIDAHARSTIALLMCVISVFVSLECLECVSHTGQKNEEEKKKLKNTSIGKKRTLLISIKQRHHLHARAPTTRPFSFSDSGGDDARRRE